LYGFRYVVLKNNALVTGKGKGGVSNLSGELLLFKEGGNPGDCDLLGNVLFIGSDYLIVAMFKSSILLPILETRS
jgi:hypothetical protein